MEKAIVCYISGARWIENALVTFGKDGRFQRWCCLAYKYVIDHRSIQIKNDRSHFGHAIALFCKYRDTQAYAVRVVIRVTFAP